MDGRRFLRFSLCGGLLAGVVGCHKNTYPQAPDLTKPGQTVGLLPASSSSKSLWGSKAPPATPVVTGAPVDGATAPRKPGSGLTPATDVAFAHTRVEAAFADPAPPNRDQLLDAARQGYARALQKDPKNEGALLGIARLYARLGEKDRAMEAYRKYVELFPNKHDMAYEVAVAHARWKDWNGAAAWCERALQLDPENRTYRKTLGFCLARAGKWEEGFAAFCKVMPEPQARFNMARVLEHLNYPDASRQQLQFALQVDPSFAAAREFLSELDQATQPQTVPTTADQANPIRQAGGVVPTQ